MKTKKTYTLALLFIFAVSLMAQKREAINFTVKNPEKTFVGAVLEYKSINDDAHRFVNITVPEAIHISFSIPVKSQTIVPSYENMMKVVRESVIASGEIKMSEGFSFQLLEINSYEALFWYFGQTVNTETFFGIPKNAKPQKTSVVVNMTQTFFSISMDFPNKERLYDKDPEVIKRAEELVYVGTLSYGRKITSLVEAEIPYIDLKLAIEEALNPNKPLSAKNRSILANADIRMMAFGNPILPEANSDNPFATAMSYFNKPVTIDDFGVPLQFTAAYIKDNGVFNNEY